MECADLWQEGPIAPNKELWLAMNAVYIHYLLLALHKGCFVPCCVGGVGLLPKTWFTLTLGQLSSAPIMSLCTHVLETEIQV